MLSEMPTGIFLEWLAFERLESGAETEPQDWRDMFSVVQGAANAYHRKNPGQFRG